MSVSRRGVKLPQRQLESMAVKAGILAEATYPADTIKDAKTGRTYTDPRVGMHVATIAAALEYGHSQNHPRPFMQQTFAQQHKVWKENVVSLLMRGQPARTALMTVGLVMKEDIRQTISDWPADNAPSWAEVKGFNHGLIQTSHLYNSVESEIET